MMVEAIGRKLNQRWEKAGILGVGDLVVRGCIEWLSQFTPRAVTSRARELEFDRELGGVSTAGVISLGGLEIPDDQRRDGVRYQPSPPDLLPKILEALALDAARYAFVDVGSGLGRVLLIASQYPFRAVSGVEISHELASRARTNLALARTRVPGSARATIFCADGSTHPLPAGPCVLYLYNPFTGETANRFLATLRRSLEHDPRDLIVIYRDPPDEIQLALSGALTKLLSFEDTVVYRTKPGRASSEP